MYLYIKKEFILEQRAGSITVIGGLDIARTAKNIKRAADSQKK